MLTGRNKSFFKTASPVRSYKGRVAKMECKHVSGATTTLWLAWNWNGVWLLCCICNSPWLWYRFQGRKVCYMIIVHGRATLSIVRCFLSPPSPPVNNRHLCCISFHTVARTAAEKDCFWWMAQLHFYCVVFTLPKLRETEFFTSFFFYPSHTYTQEHTQRHSNTHHVPYPIIMICY